MSLFSGLFLIVLAIYGMSHEANARMCISCATSMFFNNQPISAITYSTACNKDKTAAKLASIYCFEGDCVGVTVKANGSAVFTIRGCYVHVTATHFNASDPNYNTVPPDGCYPLQGNSGKGYSMNACFCSKKDNCNAVIGKPNKPKLGRRKREEFEHRLNVGQRLSILSRQTAIVKALKLQDEL